MFSIMWEHSFQIPLGQCYKGPNCDCVWFLWSIRWEGVTHLHSLSIGSKENFGPPTNMYWGFETTY